MVYLNAVVNIRKTINAIENVDLAKFYLVDNTYMMSSWYENTFHITGPL